MSETIRPHQTIPHKVWTNPSNRDHNEQYWRTSLGAYGYEFDASQYLALLAINTIGKGVASEMNQAFGSEGGGFRIVHHADFEAHDGTFSGGFIAFGAHTRELAEQSQAHFISQINEVLDGVDAGFRLDEVQQYA